MSYTVPYQNMIPGIFTVSTLNSGYPPTEVPTAGRFAYVTDGPSGAGFMECDGVAWVAADDDTNLIAAPVARTVALGSAYQATNPASAAIITVNLSSLSSNALLSTTQAAQRGELIIAATAAGVTGGTGSKVGNHENTQSGVLVVGLTIAQTQASQFITTLPKGWYFGVRQTQGANLSVVSAFDQALG